MTAPPPPEEAFAAALAGLPGMGPAGLVDLLRRYRPEQAWQQIVAGQERRPPPGPTRASAGLRTSWADAAAAVDPGLLLAGLGQAGIGVTFLDQASFPAALRSDPHPPGVLFWLGHLDALEQPCVAIVGTRRCTSYGRAMAAQLGCDLAAAGVCVVSGLALGIDGAAHAGALHAGPTGAGPVGVAASGVDRPYPQRHTELWRRVATSGAMISETAPGRPAQAWRFPARNRIIAGLCRVVVVVESHAGGGSMLTVAAAADRGIDILAVPGPVTSSSSVGTNQLLSEGLGPARHAGDVLAALGDFRPWPPARPGSPGHATRPGSGSSGRQPALDRPSQWVLAAVGWTPTPTGVVADRTGLSVSSLSTILMHLEAGGYVRAGGGWWERCRP